MIFLYGFGLLALVGFAFLSFNKRCERLERELQNHRASDKPSKWWETA